MTTSVVLNGWRRVTRTALAVLVAVCSMVPLIYSAATQHDAGEATGWAAALLAIAAAITRVLALPAVEAFLQQFLPFLAAQPDTETGTVARRARD
jgi:hypothetical protein